MGAKTLEWGLSDRTLFQGLNTIQSQNPRIIGLALFRDTPVKSGYAELSQFFQTADNVIGINKVLTPTTDPPPSLPSSQVGFADTFLDKDGRWRRALLGTKAELGPNTDQNFQFSLALVIAQHYLQAEGLATLVSPFNLDGYPNARHERFENHSKNSSA